MFLLDFLPFWKAFVTPALSKARRQPRGCHASVQGTHKQCGFSSRALLRSSLVYCGVKTVSKGRSSAQARPFSALQAFQCFQTYSQSQRHFSLALVRKRESVERIDLITSRSTQSRRTRTFGARHKVQGQQKDHPP